MVSLETTFLIDLLNGVPSAVARARALDESGEPKTVTPPAAAELLVGAYFVGGKELGRAQELLDSLTLLEFDREAYQEAGRMGADLMAQGEAMGAADLFIAAITRRHRQRLLTRDRRFGRIRGLTVETY